MTDQTTHSVLVVDDEVVIGLDLAMSLEGAGFQVQGPFSTVDRALDSISRRKPSFAILDVSLGRGATSEAVAAKLAEQGTPFVFLTGHASLPHPLTERFRTAKCLSKPIDVSALPALVRASVA